MKEFPTVGVLGLGLLGRGIAACLLGRGHRVIAWNRDEPDRIADARDHIARAITELRAAGDPAPEGWQANYTATTDLADLTPCDFVIESVLEDNAIKQSLFDELETIIRDDVPVGSNTSALPITILQSPRRHPARFVGMHWGEPCHILRFLEVIKGEQTSDEVFNATARLAVELGKEPSLVRKDVRGFVTNRLMYALFREALHLLETGVADVETIDRSFRNDVGWWSTIAGPFRLMDLTGIPAYAMVMRDLLPELSDAKQLPATMQRMLDEGAQGIANGRGFYEYTPAQCAQWRQRWTDFTWDIRKLADKHLPIDPPAPAENLPQRHTETQSRKQESRTERK